MPFYEAVQYMITTSGGKVKRESWIHEYTTRKCADGKSYIVRYIGDLATVFTPSSEDMLANDWMCIN